MSFFYTEHTYGNGECLLLAGTEVDRASRCLTLFYVESYLRLGMSLFGYFVYLNPQIWAFTEPRLNYFFWLCPSSPGVLRELLCHFCRRCFRCHLHVRSSLDRGKPARQRHSQLHRQPTDSGKAFGSGFQNLRAIT